MNPLNPIAFEIGMAVIIFLTIILLVLIYAGIIYLRSQSKLYQEWIKIHREQNTKRWEELGMILLTCKEQLDGGYIVTSPIFPELQTEGENLREIILNAADALRATLEMYEDVGKPLPDEPSMLFMQ